MTTKEAFHIFISERGAWKKIEGMNDSSFRSIRKNFAEGKVSIDKMEELLEKAGYKVVQEKLWQHPD